VHRDATELIFVVVIAVLRDRIRTCLAARSVGGDGAFGGALDLGDALLRVRLHVEDHGELQAIIDLERAHRLQKKKKKKNARGNKHKKQK